MSPNPPSPLAVRISAFVAWLEMQQGRALRSAARTWWTEMGWSHDEYREVWMVLESRGVVKGWHEHLRNGSAVRWVGLA